MTKGEARSVVARPSMRKGNADAESSASVRSGDLLGEEPDRAYTGGLLGGDAAPSGENRKEAQREEQLDGEAPQEEKPKRGRANKQLGRKGEDVAAIYLEKRGYELLERNWTCFAGEADIIALDDDCLVFVEVKTRRSVEKGLPAEAVTPQKRSKYEKIAACYVQENYFEDCRVRFDVVGVLMLDKDRCFVKHHINAYGTD